MRQQRGVCGNVIYLENLAAQFLKVAHRGRVACVLTEDECACVSLYMNACLFQKKNPKHNVSERVISYFLFYNFSKIYIQIKNLQIYTITAE